MNGHIFYNDNPEKHDGEGWYVWYFGQYYGPFDTTIEANDCLDDCYGV